MAVSPKNVVDEKLTELIKLTRCTTTFLTFLKSNKYLDDEEEQLIKNQITDIAKSRLLYDTLMLKDDWFNGLTLALEHTKQTGALKVFEQLSSQLQYQDSSQRSQERQGSSGSKPNTKPTDTRLSKQPAGIYNVVGSPTCRIGTIVNVVEKNDVGHTFLKKLNSLGRELGLDSSTRDKLKSETDDCDKFEKLLEAWKLANGENAALDVLLTAIENCEAKEISNCIRAKFTQDTA